VAAEHHRVKSIIGRIVVDSRSRRLLGDGNLLRSHRLELPYGFAPILVG
jgi:hypothetical protein